MGLKWEGDKVKLRMESASRIGVNRVMGLCVGGAKIEHPFTNRTVAAEESIAIAQPAVSKGNYTQGAWGSRMISYFKYLELGTIFTRGRTSIAQRLKGGPTKKPQNAGALPWNGGSYAPTLRPQATKHYPKLAEFIRKAFGGSAQ